MSVTVNAPAKVNLVLDVVGRREDGYHLLETVFQTVDWCDRITVDFADTTEVFCDGGAPQDESNTAYRAAMLFREYTGRNENYRITVQKHIPMQAGLAGGSADAAGVLVALNRLTGANLSLDELCELGAKIGADVPFCIRGGTALGTGTGTDLQPLPAFETGYIVIVKPTGGVSTPEAYRLVDGKADLFHPSASAFCEALKNGDWEKMTAAIGNSFEDALCLPDSLAARDMLLKNGAAAACMSGSGSSVFGLFESQDTAERCAAAMGQYYAQVRVCRPCRGITVD